jgi:hypothetical protein
MMTAAVSPVRVAAAAAAIALIVRVVSAAVDVSVEFDKAFDFTAATTWAWHPDGPGEVRMARTKDDDPEAMRARVEPIIVDAVTSELSRRGLQHAASPPDLLVTYYLLLTTTMSSQTVGQFIPATPAWGLAPFPAATQSLEIKNAGSLVLDVSAAGRVIWRGVAHAKIKIDSDNKRREALIRDAVRDLLRRFPKQ